MFNHVQQIIRNTRTCSKILNKSSNMYNNAEQGGQILDLEPMNLTQFPLNDSKKKTLKKYDGKFVVNFD